MCFLRKKCRYSSKLFSTNTKNIYSTFMRILKIWTYLYEKKMYLFNKNLEFFFLLLMWICQYFGFLIPNLATLLLMYIKLFTHLALNFHFCPKLSMIVKQIFRFKQEFWALYSTNTLEDCSGIYKSWRVKGIEAKAEQNGNTATHTP